MFAWLTVVVLVASGVLAVMSGTYLLRRRLIDDWMLSVAAVLEVGLLAQAVVALAQVRQVGGGGAEQATFAAYALSLPFLPPALALLAIKEKTRWAMGVIVAGAFSIGVMTGRLDQIWSING